MPWTLIAKLLAAVLPPKVAAVLAFGAVTAFGGWYYRGLTLRADVASALQEQGEILQAQARKSEAIIRARAIAVQKTKKVYVYLAGEVPNVEVADCPAVSVEFLRLHNRATRVLEEAAGETN